MAAMRYIYKFMILAIHIGLNFAFPTQFGTHLLCDRDQDCSKQHLVAGLDCSIDCIAEESCIESQLAFSENCDFSYLNCSHHRSCFATKIESGKDTYCEINAGSSALQQSSIHCEQDALCAIKCNDVESCASTNIHCHHSSECYIDCNHAKNSCAGLHVHAQHAKSVQVLCHENSCDHLHIYCPLPGEAPNGTAAAACTVQFYGNVSKDIEIYTSNGVPSVEIINHNHTEQDITLFCGENYAANCIMSSRSKQCLPSYLDSICNRQTKSQPSNSTTATTLTTMVLSNDDHVAKQPSIATNVLISNMQYIYGLVRADKANQILFVIFAFCSVCTILVCCVCCCQLRKQTKKYQHDLRRRRDPRGMDQSVEGRSSVDLYGHDRGNDSSEISELECDEEDEDDFEYIA